MRRTLLLAVSLVLTLAGVAVAASYKTGPYTAGSSQGDGVSLRIHRGSFSVSRISFQETCSNASGSFTEPFTFRKGTDAKLNGKINRKGRLSGRYKGPGGTVTISGRVKGSVATVKGSESGSFTPEGSAQPYNCSGSHTFKARLLIISTQQ
jgi:hypothetical protein